MAAADRPAPVEIAGAKVRPGSKKHLELPAGRLATGMPVSLPVSVAHGKQTGPVLWLSAAIHGDEINGIEIVRRVWASLRPTHLAGTVICVPIVNVFGFLEQSRYLPDRRDLNRSFPGSPRGSLAARLAHLFLSEIVERCSHGIDLHTGAAHRTNLPHIRADLDDPEVLELAEAFAPRLLMNSRVRDGSLRAIAGGLGKKVLLFEGGEALRFDARAIEEGERGVHAVMAALGMRGPLGENHRPRRPLRSERSLWMRAHRGGIFHGEVDPGDRVEKGDRLGFITDAQGTRLHAVNSRVAGVVIGLSTSPLVNRGDAVVHVAEITG